MFAFPRWWQIGVYLGWQLHACRQVHQHASLHEHMSALYVAGGDIDLLQVAHVLQHGSPERSATVTYCRCLPTYGTKTGLRAISQHSQPFTQQGQITPHKWRLHPSVMLLLEPILNHWELQPMWFVHQTCHAVTYCQGDFDVSKQENIWFRNWWKSKCISYLCINIQIELGIN